MREFIEIPASDLCIRRRSLICGVGVNDSRYKVLPRLRGKQLVCPFYQKWVSMIKRCYSSKTQDKQPRYKGCTVCDEWLLFSNFKKWMEVQDWEGNELDKDLLKKGNKVYSPSSCLMVSREVNRFLLERGSKRGDFLIGVYYNNSCKRFSSSCRNPITKKSERIGFFDTEIDAHIAYKARKRENATKLIDSKYVDCVKVAQALIRRFDA